MCPSSKAVRLFLAISFGVLAGALPAGVRAEIAVVGGADSLQLKANKATVKEALDALGAKYKFRYSAPAGLDRTINGTYQGSLREVTARLLQGYSYAATVDADGLTMVIVFGPGEKTETPAPRPRQPTAATPATVRRLSAGPPRQSHVEPNAHRYAKP
jgi:hypothetical protein